MLEHRFTVESEASVAMTVNSTASTSPFFPDGKSPVRDTRSTTNRERSGVKPCRLLGVAIVLKANGVFPGLTMSLLHRSKQPKAALNNLCRCQRNTILTSALGRFKSFHSRSSARRVSTALNRRATAQAYLSRFHHTDSGQQQQRLARLLLRLDADQRPLGRQ